MSRLLSIALLFLSTLLIAPAWAAQSADPVLAAGSWILIDASNNQVLAAKGADDRVEPASLTKLMTAYIVFDALRTKAISLDQQVKVSDKAWHMARSGSAMFIEPRKTVTVDQLIHGVIIQSGNDACVALAELIAGSEDAFVIRMNEMARRLGLGNTQFRNSTGLSAEGHYSTPRDLAKLAAAIIRDFPTYFPIYSQKDYTYNRITQSNRNRLLWMDPTVDGMKTGHTDAAGYCLVATAHRGPRRLISVLMGATGDSLRAEESQKLLNYGFQAWDTVRFFAAGATVRELEVWQGRNKTVKAGFPQDLILSVPHGRAGDVRLQFESRQPLIAPVLRGSAIGTLHLELDGQVLGNYPAFALEDVPQASWFGRTIDAMRLWFH